MKFTNKIVKKFGKLTVALFVFFLSGCATFMGKKEIQKDTPELRERFTKICSIGDGVQVAKGVLWLKAKSKQSNGQFPATVLSKKNGDLDLEVTNMIGGSEASIQVRGDRYSVQLARNLKIKEKKLEGAGTWSGIPLRWASDLFLGKIPCPLQSQVKSIVEDSNQSFFIELDASERFKYDFIEQDGVIKPVKMVWTKQNQRVEIDFEELEASSQVPVRWQAKSSEGEVKVRWKERSTE